MQCPLGGALAGYQVAASPFFFGGGVTLEYKAEGTIRCNVRQGRLFTMVASQLQPPMVGMVGTSCNLRQMMHNLVV